MFFWTAVIAVIVTPLLFLLKNRPEDAGLVADGVSTAATTAASARSVSGKASSIYLSGKGFKEVHRYRSFWFLSATQLFCGISCGLFAAHIVIFATDLGYSSLIGATFLSVQGGVSLVGVLVTGPLSDKIARKNVLAISHVVRGASFAVLVATIFVFHDSLPILYTAMALFGFGWFTTAPLVAGLVADFFGFLSMGTLIGITLACHSVGMAIGAYAGGLSFQLTGSYAPIFIACGVLEIVAAFLAYFAKRPASI